MSAKDKNTQGVSPYWVGGKTDDSEDMQAMWIPSSLSSHSGSTQAEEASEIHKTQTQGDPELFPQPSGQHQRKSTQVLSSRGISLKAMGNRANGKWSNNYISYSYDTLECFSWTQFHWPNLIKFSFSYFFSCFDHYCCFCSEIPRGTWGKGGCQGRGGVGEGRQKEAASSWNEKESGRGREKEVWTLASQSVPCMCSVGSTEGQVRTTEFQGHAHTLLLSQNLSFSRVQLVTCTLRCEEHGSIRLGRMCRESLGGKEDRVKVKGCVWGGWLRGTMQLGAVELCSRN